MLDLIPFYMYRGGPPLARPERLYDYLIATQGIIKRVENERASADLLLAPLQTELIGLGLEPYPLQPLRFKPPRIPAQLLGDVLADARSNLDLEFMYHFRFAPERGWFVTRPEQTQSWARVGYRNEDPTGVILDLHSHNVMPAFFSPTDNGDEKGGRFYGVIGHLDQPDPQLVLRFGLYGHWLTNIPALTLFEASGPFVETYDNGADLAEVAPTSWVSRLFQWRSG